MHLLSMVIGIAGSFLELALLFRAWRGALLRHFPLFYSYIAYVFVGSTATFALYYLRSRFYPLAFWYFFLVGLLAEFAVLAQIGDHIFDSYPAVRVLGRFVICSVTAISLVYILPGLINPASKARGLFDFTKGTLLAKAAIVIVLLAAARHVGIPLGRNVAGMLFGFSLYLGINVPNFVLHDAFGPAIYSRTFSTIGPLSWDLCLLAWTVALWRYEPAIPAPIRVGESGTPAAALRYRLEQFNTALESLLRK